MKINFTKSTSDRSVYTASEYNLSNQHDELSSEIHPTPALRINGLNTFQSDYVRDEEIRTAIRIKE